MAPFLSDGVAVRYNTLPAQPTSPHIAAVTTVPPAPTIAAGASSSTITAVETVVKTTFGVIAVIAAIAYGTTAQRRREPRNDREGGGADSEISYDI